MWRSKKRLQERTMSQLPIEIAGWQMLRPHLERDALIVVQPHLDLAAAAQAVAADDASAVRLWIDQGGLGKPSTAQVDEWSAEPLKPFRFIIVQPYVLIQEGPAEAGEEELS
jgi:hypothetical protein